MVGVDRATVFSLPGRASSPRGQRPSVARTPAIRIAAAACRPPVGHRLGATLTCGGSFDRRRRRIRHGRHAQNPIACQEPRHVGAARTPAVGTSGAVGRSNALARATGIGKRRWCDGFREPDVEHRAFALQGSASGTGTGCLEFGVEPCRVHSPSIYRAGRSGWRCADASGQRRARRKAQPPTRVNPRRCCWFRPIRGASWWPVRVNNPKPRACARG